MKTTANQRIGERQSVSQQMAKVITSSAPPPNAGTMRTEPSSAATHFATSIMKPTPSPMSHQTGASSPKGAVATPSIAAGITTNSTSGRVSELPMRP